MPGRGHLDLPEDQRLDHVAIGEQLAAVEQLRRDLALGRRFQLLQEIGDGQRAAMAGGGVQGDPQLDRIGARGPDEGRAASGRTEHDRRPNR